MLNTIEIKYLADIPECIPIIAQWLYHEFGNFLNGKPVKHVIGSLHSRLNTDALPLSIIAVKGNEPVGTVSLKISDMDIRDDLTPWVAGLYVKPGHRGIGLGTHLVKTIESKAKELGIRELYLFTPGAFNFYEKIGWRRIEELRYKSMNIVIMKKGLEP